MKRSYNIHEAKTKFSSIISQVASGEDIIISKSGTPIAVISPYRGPKKKTLFGLCKDIVGPMADDFDSPMDEGFLSHFK